MNIVESWNNQCSSVLYRATKYDGYQPFTYVYDFHTNTAYSRQEATLEKATNTMSIL